MINKTNKKIVGATMVEYALIVALISVIAILALTNIGTEIKRIFGAVETSVVAVPSP